MLTCSCSMQMANSVQLFYHFTNDLFLRMLCPAFPEVKLTSNALLGCVRVFPSLVTSYDQVAEHSRPEPCCLQLQPLIGVSIDTDFSLRLQALQQFMITVALLCISSNLYEETCNCLYNCVVLLVGCTPIKGYLCLEIGLEWLPSLLNYVPALPHNGRMFLEGG